MYAILAMIKDGVRFSSDDLHDVLLDITRTGKASLTRNGNLFHLVSGDGTLDLAIANEPHVEIESNEIAESYSIPCQGSCSRIEMSGDDPDMELFNDFLLINERLQATGNFVIFDPQECKLFFDDPS